MTDTVRVPREPTEAMIEAAQVYCHADRPGRAVDIYRAMLAASTPVGGWEDISTAPKDGTKIIGLTKLGEVFRVWWHEFEEGWDWQDDCDSEQQVVGWMPLPPPPSVSTGSRPQEAVPSCADFAARLTGSEYGEEGSSVLWAEMKAARCVAVFGASDDLMEFEGAIRDEVGCYDGGSAWVTPEGLFEGDCGCKYAKEAKRSAVRIKALWGAEPDYSWTYETTIPHATFEVVEGGGPYCRGIVFSLDALKATTAAETGSVGTAAREAGRSAPTPPVKTGEGGT